MSPGIIFPRQTQSVLISASGALVSGDQIAEIIVPSTGLYLARFDTWGLTAIAAPRAMELLLERQLPTPLQSFKLALLGVSTTGQGAQYAARVLFRGQVPDSLGGFSEQWSYLVRLRTALPLGETVGGHLSLTPLAFVLGISAGEERLNHLPIEQVHALKVL